MCKYLSDLGQCQLTYDVGEITNSILLVQRDYTPRIKVVWEPTNKSSDRKNKPIAIKLPRIENEHLRIDMKIARSSVRIIHRLSFSLLFFEYLRSSRNGGGDNKSHSLEIYSMRGGAKSRRRV